MQRSHNHQQVQIGATYYRCRQLTRIPALTKVSQDVEKHEKGTYQYQVCSGDEDPRKVIVFEEYEDQTAHLGTYCLPSFWSIRAMGAFSKGQVRVIDMS